MLVSEVEVAESVDVVSVVVSVVVVGIVVVSEVEVGDSVVVVSVVVSVVVVGIAVVVASVVV